MMNQETVWLRPPEKSEEAEYWNRASCGKRFWLLRAVHMNRKYVPKYAARQWNELPSFIRDRIHPYMESEANPRSYCPRCGGAMGNENVCRTCGSQMESYIPWQEGRLENNPRLERVWVVTEPTHLSTIDDICFSANWKELRNQYMGGLGDDYLGNQISAVFTTEPEARAHADMILRHRDAGMRLPEANPHGMLNGYQDNPAMMINPSPNPPARQVEVGKEVYAKFHDFAPTKMYSINIPQPKVLVRIGSFSAIGYHSDKWKFTSKKGKLRQKYGNTTGQHYLHEFKTQPKDSIVAFSPDANDPEHGLLICWRRCRVTRHGIED